MMVTDECEKIKKNQYLLKTVKLNRFMIVNVRSSDETRHVYSPASSSDTSDKIRLHVQAYLNKKTMPYY
jgi:hypothetical protein